MSQGVCSPLCQWIISSSLSPTKHPDRICPQVKQTLYQVQPSCNSQAPACSRNCSVCWNWKALNINRDGCVVVLYVNFPSEISLSPELCYQPSCDSTQKQSPQHGPLFFFFFFFFFALCRSVEKNTFAVLRSRSSILAMRTGVPNSAKNLGDFLAVRRVAVFRQWFKPCIWCLLIGIGWIVFCSCVSFSTIHKRKCQAIVISTYCPRSVLEWVVSTNATVPPYSSESLARSLGIRPH